MRFRFIEQRAPKNSLERTGDSAANLMDAEVRVPVLACKEAIRGRSARSR